jgi:hypothetical protein
LSSEKECNCCIKIEDSVCIILTGDVDIDKVKDSLGALLEVKTKKIFGYPAKSIEPTDY